MVKPLKCPTKEEIIEINRRIGEEGVLINEGNLEFILKKVEIEKSPIKKARILIQEIAILHPSLMEIKELLFILCYIS